MQKTYDPNPNDQTGVIMTLAKQIAQSAKENDIGHGELAEWIGLICRMALWLFEVDGKRFETKLTFEQCEKRSREYLAAKRSA